jgi:hypothetical protein
MPVVIVVTGLENESPIDKWWEKSSRSEIWNLWDMPA